MTGHPHWLQAIRALLWVWLLGWSALATGQTITLAADDASTDLVPAAQFWYDARADRTLDDWQQALQQAAGKASASPSAPGFAWVAASEMPLGRRTGALWVAVHLNNPHAAVLRHLAVSPERLEQVDAWLLTGPDTASAQPLGRAGASVPLMKRPLHSNVPAWRVNLPPGPSTLLLRVQSRTTLQPHIVLWEPAAHTLHMRRADLRHGLEWGALALAALLTLVFALWLRESTWAWYGATSASTLLYQSCFSGQAVLWLWPAHPQ